MNDRLYRHVFIALIPLLLMGGGIACAVLDTSLWSSADSSVNHGTEPQIGEDSTSNVTPEWWLKGKVVDATTDEPLSATIHFVDEAPSNQSEPVVANRDGMFETSLTASSGYIRVEMPGYIAQDISLDPITANLIEPPINLTPRQLRGTLLAADTQQPLSGVLLETRGDTPHQTVTTQADGTFELTRVAPDDIMIVQPPEGYLPLEVTLVDQDPLTVTAQPRLLTITVKNLFYNTPGSGVDVVFSETFTATTNAEGQAAFSHIPAAGDIVIQSPGYLSVTLPYDGEAELPVDLIPAGLQGVVRDQERDEPIPQATFYLGNEIFQADDQGKFMIDTFPTDPEPLMIKAAGYHRTYTRLGQTGVFTDGPAPFSGVEGRWAVTASCTDKMASDVPCLDFNLEPFAVKAIYIPFHYLGGRDLMISYLDFVAETDLNAIVVDVKGDFGFIGWESEVELVTEIEADEWRQPYWMPLDELVAEAKKRNVYTIARIVVFKDDPMARNKPEWATVREDGSAWIDGEGLGWANPFKEEVWDYNIALAKEVAAFGFDEINLDYIRFPSDGDIGAIVYEEENTLETRTAAIGEFMQRMRDELRPAGVFLSVDVFGLTVWVEPESDMNIGQRVIDIAPHIDYLAPMVYPSTFIPGNLGYDDPSAEPYGVIFNSQNEAETRVPPHVKVRPWLQAYWYSVEEMQLQKQGAEDADSVGWAWWNAGGKYDDELFGVTGEEANEE